MLTCGQLPGSSEFHGSDAQSRAIQGLITGVGFLGAGVILHEPGMGRIQGLTTAAAIWVAALFGAACGAGVFPPVMIAFVLLVLVLACGGSVERRVHRWLRPKDPAPPPQDS
ncbi:MAG: hypothetical protein NVS9B10_24970 [Nevskia sp.]